MSEDKKSISTNIPPSLLARLKDCTNATGMSRSEFIAEAIDRFCALVEIEQEKARQRPIRLVEKKGTK